MRVSISMFAAFAATLAVLHLTDVAYELGIAESARLLILMTVIAGLFVTIREQRAHWRKARTVSCPERIRLKCWSIVIGLLGVLAYAKLMTEFGVHPFGTFLSDYAMALPVILLLLPFYVRWADKHLAEPDDAYHAFGKVLVRQSRFRMREHKAFLLAWIVKIAFIPFMYGALVLASEKLVSMDLIWRPAPVINWLFMFGLAFDLVIGASGYLFASKLLGNEVISTDGTWSGWLVCMICYPPLLGFFQIVYRQVDSIVWDRWLLPSEPLYWVWAVLVTTTWLIYWLSTASFGLRFSNLSWRGLVAHGPYAWTKHPGYVSKNLYWWLHTVPFVGVSGWGELARNVLGLCCLSLVYYLRAKTEER
ncbi:MAG: hypothetical protein JSR42_10040 [Proteobacteria bacterium]|nr:hypothetical protein [Pseudomonadota bacterium]